MLAKIFSIDTKPGAYFRRIDWTAFWGATLVAFLVYFFTLGPSVGLEDSGELATAADHLGVPHPPGYPFWSLCCWIFCRLFSWVTYMGQPTPAWAVSLFSAVAGAFAAGCTAMLICRSGSDMLDSLGDDASETTRKDHALMGLMGGIGGSLVFAFSPVEWSQSTIVEIYSLNALFLMAVFLLSYRWMRRQSDKMLWLIAFIFGLGLTNYQVLLLAALPIAIMIALRDIRMFRDFVMILVPIGLTAKVLQIGSMMRASRAMQADVINKFEPVLKTDSCPNEVILWIGCVLLVVAPLVGVFLARRGDARARKFAIGTGLAGAGLLLLAATIFASATEWSGPLESPIAPLLEPTKYVWIGAFLAGSLACSLGVVFAPAGTTWRDREVMKWLIGAGACAFVAMAIAGSLRAADAAGYTGQAFSFAKPHLTLLAGIVLLFLLALTTPRGLAFAIPVAAVQVTAHVLLAKGAMNGLTNPHSWWFFWPIIWNFAMLALAMVALPNGRAIAGATFFAELGVSFYAYMPIVSDLRNPPMNWGYPRTWEGFKHAIMRGQYEAIKMPDFFSAAGFDLFLKQLGFYFQDLRMQFTLVAAALALLPFTLWKLTVRTAKKTFHFNAVTTSTALYVAVAGLVIVFSELLDVTGGEVPLRLDKLMLLVLAIFVMIGLAIFAIQQCRVVYGMIRGRGETPPAEISFRQITLRAGADNVTQQWLIAVLSCFAIMSLFLVALANVKGDIQDGFIQKVKFISSHAMFSIWIGYGLAVGLVIAKEFTDKTLFAANERMRSLTFRALLVAAACVALIPIYENYTNDRLVFAMGSAEQNGHTFGWQFGNYQLRGANAIREELSSDEEPLPNPMWPEEMEPSSIFFGGTDPGRFVPTYMIYSARVRPDVYLITQNALADDTYMSVERDLYGDEIWIPSKEDSAESFNIYVSEVQSGKRQANADLKIENGRVQVTGALGVMEINGVLTKMMFDHERLRHSFYVEESYVIQWMYPYLSPHGLIMKINPDKDPINESIVRNDMEFWDWYHRRLLRDPAFRRDFPAQKSFSKLRAAIAGLYAHMGYYQTADTAFREAVLLYPASPEATFRYAQEVLMPMRKWDVVLDMLAYTDRVDPNNTRTTQMRNYITRLRTLTAEISSLQAKAAKGPLPVEESLALARDLQAIGHRSQAVKELKALLARPEADNFQTLMTAADLLSACSMRGDAANAMKRALDKAPANIDPRLRREMAVVLAQGGLNADAEAALNEYLRAFPKDPEGWLQLSVIKDALGQIQASQSAIIQAYKLDPNAASRRLQSDERLQRIAAPLFRRQ